MRFGLALAAGALVASVSATAASAIPVGPPEGTAGPPIATCPTGAGAEWLLVQPSGPQHLSAQFDFNNDGWVCGRWLPAFDGQSAVAFLDNVVR
jgi:hypothetical protein